MPLIPQHIHADIPGTRSKDHRNALLSVSHKVSRSRRILRILGRDTSRCQNHPSCNACVRCLPHRRRKVRLTQRNASIPSLADSQATLVAEEPPQKDSSVSSFKQIHRPSIKRKHADISSSSVDHPKPPPRKRRKRGGKADSLPDAVHTDQQNCLAPAPPSAATKPLTKTEKEKLRQREKKKRQKATKQLKAQKHRIHLEQSAKQAESLGHSSGFLVRFPLERVSDLSGRSVSRNFRKADLDLNEIAEVEIDAVLRSEEAREVYECLNRPLYFEESCAERIEALKRSPGLKGVPKVASLLVTHKTCPPGTHLKFASEFGVKAHAQPPFLDSTVLDAIEHVLKDTREPHHMESSQNSEEKIKALFKPVLQSLGMDDVLVTNGFAWRESIPLRSTIDLATHAYAPKSDVAIVQLLPPFLSSSFPPPCSSSSSSSLSPQSTETAKILVIFEAYSRCGQSHTTPDVNRADRVRLLIQGSYISRKESKPAVVFYLTRDKQMETILLFPQFQEGTGDHDGAVDGTGDECKFCYYVEKRPFYSEASWVSLLCQVINLVWAQRQRDS